MKHWTYGINSMYKTGSVQLIEAPFWVFWAEGVADWMCARIPAIPFPAVFRVVDEGEIYNWKEWYGDLRQVFHVAIYTPIQEWAWRRQRECHFEIPYEKLREAFYEEDREWWDDNETDAEGRDAWDERKDEVD